MKQNVIKDAYVKVLPDIGYKTPQTMDKDSLIKELKYLVTEINRHIDGVESVDWEIEYQDICEHCKSEWETAEDGCPLCCNKAVEEFDNAALEESR